MFMPIYKSSHTHTHTHTHIYIYIYIYIVGDAFKQTFNKANKKHPFYLNLSYINSNFRKHEANFIDFDLATLFFVKIVYT